MQPITREQFEDILFDPNMPVTEKRTFKKSSIRGAKIAVIKLVSKGKLIAVREITPEGQRYYRVV